MLRAFLVLFLLWVGTGVGSAQSSASATDSDYLAWSATRRITPADFRLQHKSSSGMQGSIADFLLDVDGHVIDLLGKRGNAIIRNRMLRSASWLDTTASSAPANIRYQQTLFDLHEIYTRKLRQQARASAKKMLLVGKPTLTDLMEGLMKELEQRKLQYTDDTNFGLLPDKQAAWEQTIRQELAALAAYEVL